MTLGPEMQAEGWREIGDQELFIDLLWVHVPSSRCLTVTEYERKNVDSPVWGAEPEDPETSGYLVCLRVHDSLGNPISGDGFWIQSFGHAVKLAREIRKQVLGERGEVTRAEQLTLDDVLERGMP